MEYKETDKHIKEHILLDREFYDFYRQNRKKPVVAINQYNYFVKAINGISKTLRDMVNATNGGVDIRGFGYFSNVRSRRKRKNMFETNPMKKHLRHYHFGLFFYPEEPYRCWDLKMTEEQPPNKLKEYRFTPESALVKYELEDYSRTLSRATKDVKFIK
jgi:hypothetical protein